MVNLIPLPARDTPLSISDHQEGFDLSIKTYKFGRAPVAHSCNPNYSGGRGQEDRGSHKLGDPRPAPIVGHRFLPLTRPKFLTPL
jgi:hypothetical protein